MHRPTRKHRHLIAKAERKIARSRRSGNKARRWKKQLEQYRALSQNSEPAAAGDAKPAKAKG